MAYEAVARRKAANDTKVDLASFLIDSEVYQSIYQSIINQSIKVHPDDVEALKEDNDNFEKRMDTGEIVRNIIALLFAGADTQSSSLSFTTLCLANALDKQVD